MLIRTADEYKALSRKLAVQVDQLQVSLKRSQDEGNEVTSYLNKEIKKLQDEKKTMQDMIEEAFKAEEAQRTRVASAHAEALAAHQAEADDRWARAMAENTRMTKELQELRVFREEKDVIDRTVAEKDERYDTMVKELQDQMDTMERKFLLEFDKQQKLALAKIEELRSNARADAMRTLDVESRELRVEVVWATGLFEPSLYFDLDQPLTCMVFPQVEVREELAKHIEFNEILRKENDKFRTASKKAKLDSELNEQRDQEYALRGVKQQKEIKELAAKNKQLERALSQVLADFEAEKRNWIATHARELEDAQLEAAGLRQLVKIKTKELKQIKRLSQMILDQRSEVEHFLLEAIDQVKVEIRAKREADYKTAKAE
jgi:hypothetical protein